MKPIIAIVGRPNVGKSTLFNRITGTKDALVDDLPGVTRDRIYGDAQWDGKVFTLVDTGGFTDDDADGFSAHIRFQVQQAIEDADAILLVLDGKNGLSPFDREMGQMLRGVDKPVLTAVNKVDAPEQEDRLYDFYGLGLEPMLPLSAEHRYGFNDMMDTLVAMIPEVAAPPEENVIRLAVVGRPNAGKSSLINRLLGEERLVVSDIPGTTRDAIDSLCEFKGKKYLLVDTAGIRRKGKVSRKLEKFSVIKALRSLDRCDVALVVVDATEGITEQDVTVAGYANDRGCACVLLLNKWDAVPDKDHRSVKNYVQKMRDAARFLPFAPVLTISAKTGQRVSRIFGEVDRVFAQYVTRIGTGALNRALETATERHPPPMHKGRRLKFYYATQVSTRPPTIVLFVNHPAGVHFSYNRYLSNQLREATGLDRTPLRLLLRQRSGRIEFGAQKAKSKNRAKAGRSKSRK